MTVDFDKQETQTDETAASLPKEYHRQYHRLAAKLRRDSLPGPERAEALEGLLILLGRAQALGKPAVSIYGGDFKGFYRELLSGMGTALPRRMRKKRQILRLSCAAVLTFGLIAGAAFPLSHRYAPLGTALYGLSYFQQHHDYTYSAEPLKQPIGAEVDLKSPDKAIGATLWSENGCRIKIENLFCDENGAWILILRASGSFSPRGGALVTPLTHQGQGDFYAYELDRRLTVSYGGSSSYAAPAGAAAFETKNSDLLAWSLFPAENPPEIGQNSIVGISLENFLSIHWNPKT